MKKSDDELTGADVFGEPTPSDNVKPTYSDPCRGYRPRGRWVRRSDNKWVRLPDRSEAPETQDDSRTY